MKRTDITRLGRERDDGLDIFSVEGVRLNTPRLSVPVESVQDATVSAAAALDVGTSTSSVPLADAPEDGAAAADAAAAPEIKEGTPEAAGSSGTAGSSDAAGSSGVGAEVAAGGAKGKEGVKKDSDVLIQARGMDVKWKSQMSRNPITGEGMETEEYSDAGKKKTFRDC